MAEIILKGGRVALVDDEDFDRLSPFKWFSHLVAKSTSRNYYARRNSKIIGGVRAPPVYMHREVIGAARGQIVDHINGDTLDNRRVNLRIVTASQNNMNRKSGRPFMLKGAYPSGRRWTSSIQIDGQNHYLGCFATAEQAARAYDRKAFELFGEFAKLNFPHELRSDEQERAAG